MLSSVMKMKYLIILLLCSLATAKVCIQSAFSKTSIKNTADVLLFNTLSFVVSAVIFSYRLVNCPPVVWLFAFVGAASTVLFQLTYTKALSSGNVSITVLIINMAVVITVLTSFFFYNDSISTVRFIGILLTLLAFLLSANIRTSKVKQEKKWLFLTFSAMLTSALGNIVMKVLGESQYSSYNREYVSALYIIASILAFALYTFLSAKGEKKSLIFDKKLVLSSAGIGVILAIYMAINSYSLSVIEGTFLFPAISGGCVAMGAISGVIFFKDKLTKKQILSIISGIAAAVLINF